MVNGPDNRDNPTEASRIDRSIAQRLMRTVARGRRSAVRTLTVGLVAVFGTVAAIGPVAAQAGGGGGGGGGAANTMGNAICQTGAGKLITMGLFAIAILLVYSAIIDVYRGLTDEQSNNSQRRAQSGSHFASAAKKVVGGIIIAASPSILATLGFSLLDCVNAVQIFS